MATIDEKKEFIKLRAQGISLGKIAVRLKKSKTTLIKWEREFEEEIAQLKSIELESLYEMYYLSKQNRIKTYGEMLIQIKDALDLKGFKDMPVDKLLKYYTHFYALLKEEYVEPQFKTDEEIVQSRGERELVDKLVTNPDQLKEQN